MRDLYFEVSNGVGNTVKGKDIKPCNYSLPYDYKREDENNFIVNVYGHVINPSETKSPFSRTRNMIAKVHCFYAGFERKFREECIETACSFVDTVFKEEPKKKVIVIKDLLLDKDEIEDIVEFLANMHAIVTNAAKNYDDYEDIVVCMHVNDEEMKFIIEKNRWNCDHVIAEEAGFILMY